MARIFPRSRRRWLLLFSVVLLILLVPKVRRALQVNYNYWVADGGRWHAYSGPPKYVALRRAVAALPQHDLSLPFPEGKTGRYVKFSNHVGYLGWNNCFNEVLMNAHLAYISGRGYVFNEYEWAPEHYQWPKEKWVNFDPHTPLSAIVSGPVAGGPFEPGDPAPRAISEHWFEVPAVAQATGSEVLAHWQQVLRDAPERCVEIIRESADDDPFPQIFDLGLFGGPRVLTLWDSFSRSPISRLLDASPIARTAIDNNKNLFLPNGPRPPHPAPRKPFERVLAIHLRRGDYEGHCRWIAYLNSAFYSWNLFPHLPDRFVPEPDAPGKDERFLARCWPDVEGIVRKAAEARRDYLAHAKTLPGTGHESEPMLDVMYVLTNEKSAWLEELKKALRRDGWTVATSQDLVLDAEQRDVSMAVDMEIATTRRGWSSFTSNIVYQRLLDKRDPITIRFT
ncbi:hypothetical protein MSAN_02261000 [Mycena sanguinolenta]|uniref:Uncharacterized protein n=1 Tax=Mycena sanguinolenta TaxID=230812 RepID=A0A8H6XAB6_9AGAR|nr:hypothetical protein MSAN_02261000 [Mycena sanguinolenta]